MLYAQLKKVLEIDDRITVLHEELTHLYNERAKFVSSTPGSSTAAQTPHLPYTQASIATPYDPWIQRAYAKLANAWDIYDITIPELKKLQGKLIAARNIIESIEAVDKKIAKNMQILLVPPKKIVSFPVAAHLREKQAYIEELDFINPALSNQQRSQSTTWRMLVVLTSPSGLNYGSVSKIWQEKKYKLCGYDARALGLQEYGALTLQSNKVIDQNSWTMLLKGINPGETSPITSAKFVDKQYRFELDESGGVFGDERFRPAIEVQA